MRYGIESLNELRREMDRLFDGAFSREASSPAQWQPACDVTEGEDHYLLTLEVPGVPKDQIKIEVVDRQINVSGERKLEPQSGAWYSERRFGGFFRSFTLPSGVDGSKIEAHHQDGILRILVPKAESARPRQIKIAEGGQPGFLKKLLGQNATTEPKSDHAA
jgi:HSP20 family protein